MLPPKGNTMDPNKKANFEIDPKNLIMPLTVSHGHCQDVGGPQSPGTVSHMKGPSTILANAKVPEIFKYGVSTKYEILTFSFSRCLYHNFLTWFCVVAES